MTATRVKVCPMDTEIWTSLFPSRIDSENSSRRFVFHLLAISISSITYLRSAFPDRAFVDKNLNGLRLKLLDRHSEIVGVVKLCKKIKGAMEAVEKRYLRTLTLGFYVDPDRPEEAVETYAFHFGYGSDGSVSMDMDTQDGAAQDPPCPPKSSLNRDRLFRKTVQSLKLLLKQTQELSPLPDQAFMTVQLLYFDDRTPKDYQPPGFEASNLLFKLNEEDDPGCRTKTPTLSTPWHTFSAVIRSVESLTHDPTIEESAFETGQEATQPESDRPPTLQTPQSMASPNNSPVSYERLLSRWNCQVSCNH